MDEKGRRFKFVYCVPNRIVTKSYPGLPKCSFPWRRGPGIGPIAKGREIIYLTETHEHDGCKTPMFDSYLKLAVWNEAKKNGKEYGGILALLKEKEGRHIQLVKEDTNKQHLWFKIIEN